MVFRRFVSFAAPALAVGLLLVSQAVGRVQSSQPGRIHSTAQKGHHHRGSLSAEAGGITEQQLQRQQNLINRLLNREQRFLVRDRQLLARQSQLNARLIRLYSSGANQGRINQTLRAFANIQRQIDANRNKALAAFSVFGATIKTSLQNLSQFANGDAALTQYIQSVAMQQTQMDQQLQVILNRPPATPFTP